MDPVDQELLTGMGNCFAACGDDFEGTVGMVAGARGRDPAEVKRALERIRHECARDPEYATLRRRIPESFPV